MGKSTLITAEQCRDNEEQGIDNLLGFYAQATTSELRRGLNWYADAYADAVDIAGRYNLGIVTVIKVAAALSPRLKWVDNMPCAELVIRYHAIGGYIPDIARYRKFGGEEYLQRTAKIPADAKVIGEDKRFTLSTNATRVNMIKACWILEGHADVISGQKVTSFVDNILNHETSDLVTVDSHAIQAWLGTIKKGTYAVNPAWYPILEADYQKASHTVGCTPLQFQAVVWIVKKRLADTK